MQQALVCERKARFIHARSFVRLAHQEALADFELFLLRVAGQTQDFHAVLQRLGNGVQDVRRANEHHFGQVVFDIQVMIHERAVDLGIENFHERRRRVAAEVHRHLVHFIEHEDGIHRAGLLHHLDDLAGQRADIGTAMPADFGFIAHPAQRNAHELASRCMPDGHGQRSLAHSRRPHEAQNRALRILHQLANRQKFQDPFLDFVEAVVLFVQDFLRGFNIADFF